MSDTSTIRALRWFNQGNGFMCIPVELARDKELSEAELRVLLVLASHAGRSDTVWPSRDRLVTITGHNPSTISAATTRLHQLGWIRKEKRGATRSTQYVLLPRKVSPT